MSETEITRREFLKRAAGATAWLLVPKIPLPRKESSFTPETIHQIPVYGLREKIKSSADAERLYEEFDSQFDNKLSAEMKSKNKWEQRDFLLAPDERYLEVEVRESVYKKFLARRQETGVDFVEWIKMHVDLMNRAMENAKPPAPLKARLSRILVINDAIKSDISRVTKDIDATWFIKEDYRPDTKKEIMETMGGYFWSFYHDKKGNLIFRWPPGGNKIEKTYSFPPKSDSLTGRNGVWLDCGLTHEWSHMLLNLPDEYTFDVAGAPFRFKNFFFETGAFHEPWLSPNLSYLILRNRRRRIRGYFSHPEGAGVAGYRIVNQDRAERPSKIKLEFYQQDKPLEATVNCHTVRYKEGEYSPKTFPKSPDQVGTKGKIELGPKVFRPVLKAGDIIYPFNWIFRIQTKNSYRELHFPIAAFNMTKIARKDTGEYKINFTGYDNSAKNVQALRLIDETDFNPKKDQPYAYMKIDGTSCYYVWYLRQEG